MGNFFTGDPESKCLNIMAKWYADAGLNIVLDFVIFSLPIPVLRSMTLSCRAKIWLYGVFMLGFLYVLSISRLFRPSPFFYFLLVSFLCLDVPDETSQ